MRTYTDQVKKPKQNSGITSDDITANKRRDRRAKTLVIDSKKRWSWRKK
jgi:hypothetical protein